MSTSSRECEMCGEMVPESDLMMSEHGEICRSCEATAETTPSGPVNWLEQKLALPPAAATGLGLVILPFFCSFRISINQDEWLITSVIFGGLAVLSGLGAVYQQKMSTAKLASPKFLVGLLIVVGLGVFHILDGMNML